MKSYDIYLKLTLNILENLQFNIMNFFFYLKKLKPKKKTEKKRKTSLEFKR